MPYVKFICVKCGHSHRCEVKTYEVSFSRVPDAPLCFNGLIQDDGSDKADFEYIECRLDEV
jgi:hypothetical protein